MCPVLITKHTDIYMRHNEPGLQLHTPGSFVCPEDTRAKACLFHPGIHTLISTYLHLTFQLICGLR